MFCSWAACCHGWDPLGQGTTPVTTPDPAAGWNSEPADKDSQHAPLLEPWWAPPSYCPDWRPIGTCPGKALAASEAQARGGHVGSCTPDLASQGQREREREVSLHSLGGVGGEVGN